jgi:negative regulator of sigma E activity
VVDNLSEVAFFVIGLNQSKASIMDATKTTQDLDPLLKERAWISAFADGEADATPANWARLTAADETKRAWREYHTVGDLLRASDALPVRPVFARKVMLALDEQPTVLAPPKKTKSWVDSVRHWGVPGAAVAAAAVAVVWIAMPQFGGQSMTAKVPAPQNQASGAPVTPVVVPPGVQIMPASVPGPAAAQPSKAPVEDTQTK